MVQQQGAPSVPELVELAGHKAHLERERALSRIEHLLEGAGGAAMQLTVCRKKLLLPPPLPPPPPGRLAQGHLLRALGRQSVFLCC